MERKRNTIILLVAVIIIILIVLAVVTHARNSAMQAENSAGTTTTTTGTVSQTQTGTADQVVGDNAKIGQALVFDGLIITPEAVVEDNRCPVGAQTQCVVAGTVELRAGVVMPATATVPQTDSTIIFTLGTTTMAGGQPIVLSAVAPNKTEGATISASDYTFTFSVPTAKAN